MREEAHARSAAWESPRPIMGHDEQQLTCPARKSRASAAARSVSTRKSPRPPSEADMGIGLWHRTKIYRLPAFGDYATASLTA